MYLCRLIVIFSLLAAAACGDPAARQGRVIETGLSTVLSMDVYSAGERVHLLVAGQGKDESVQTHYLYSDGGGQQWSKPVQVDAGITSPHKPARNLDAQIAAHGRHLVAAWQVAGDGWGGFGPMVTAVSSDGGLHWQPGPNPAGENNSSEQGFIDLAVDHEGNFHIVWLDSRDGERGLRYAQSGNQGANWSGVRTIDSHTCECCWNRIRAHDDRLFTSYRDSGPRDMHIAISDKSGIDWSHNTGIGDFNWEFDGCPHAGGGLAVGQGKKNLEVHTTVWTGKESKAGLYYAHSDNAGRSWNVPRQLAGESARHSDVDVYKQHVITVWSQSTADGSGIMLAESYDNGSTFQPAVELHCSDSSKGSHPRVVATGDHWLITWTTSNGQLCSTGL